MHLQLVYLLGEVFVPRRRCHLLGGIYTSHVDIPSRRYIYTSWEVHAYISREVCIPLSEGICFVTNVPNHIPPERGIHTSLEMYVCTSYEVYMYLLEGISTGEVYVPPRR